MRMRTLVLNAGYEPLAVVTFRRALVLVLTGKASVVAEGDDPVVGPQDVLGRPSVILLHRYIRPRYNTITAVSRRGVLRRDGQRCAYCGKAAHTIDHVQPKSRGGADSWENLVAACLRCNNAKGDHTPAEMGWKLGFAPGPPKGTVWQIKELEKPAPDWDPFLLPESAA
jgi:5-methylcytosine-specific restriction endonuclease McrA